MYLPSAKDFDRDMLINSIRERDDIIASRGLTVSLVPMIFMILLVFHLIVEKSKRFGLYEQ